MLQQLLSPAFYKLIICFNVTVLKSMLSSIVYDSLSLTVSNLFLSRNLESSEDKCRSDLLSCLKY